VNSIDYSFVKTNCLLNKSQITNDILSTWTQTLYPVLRNVNNPQTLTVPYSLFPVPCSLFPNLNR
jgi:hypothetical protein